LKSIRPAHVLVLAATFGGLGNAVAQYKVVGPDGSVTYTDRPPVAANVKVTPLGRAAVREAGSPEQNLPPDLRAAVQRHPVTLYASASCQPCDSGRRLLQQRGVPYTEKRISTEEDAQALERIVGALTVPALMIGAQPLRGFAEQDWVSFLDAAGYPKENKLPRGWPTPEATAMVQRAAPVAAARAPAPPPPAEPAPVPEPSPGSIRF